MMFRHLMGLLVLTVQILGFSTAARAEEMTWTFQSDYRYRVQFALFSKSPRWEWPGHGNAYNLDDSDEHEVTISCMAGQKVCYGAWVTGRNDLIWGVGEDGNDGCRGCCYTCGSANPTVNLGN